MIDFPFFKEAILHVLCSMKVYNHKNKSLHFFHFPSIDVFGGLIVTGSWTIVAIDGYRFPSRAINSLYIPVIHSVHESTASIIDLG